MDKHRKAAEQSRKELKKCEVQIASLQQTCNVLIKQTKPRDAELSALEAECKSLREALAKQKETLILSDEEAKKLVSYQERLQYMEATKLGLQKALAEERRKVLEQESIIKTLKVVHDAQRTKMAQIQDALKGII